MNLTHDRVSPEMPPPPGSAGLLKCDDIQVLLSAYMMRELGDVQSRVVREHLRQCEACRRVASELQAMLDALHAGAAEARAGEGARLSDERRARIWRAVFHPVLDWMYCHHRLVSIMAAVLAVLIVLFVCRHAEIFRKQKLEEGIPIWQMFRSGRLPELVEKAREERAQNAREEPPPPDRE